MRNTVMVLIVVALLCIAMFLGVLVIYKSSIPAGTAPSNATPEPTALLINTEEPTADVSETETPAAETPTEAPTPSDVLRGLVIGIDPGHQGRSNNDKEPCAPWGPEANPAINNETMKTKTASGTEGKFSGVAEYVATLDISMQIKERLELLGATVVMTRESHDVDLSNIDRAKIGNDANCDVVIRIHCNGAEKESVSGVEAYVRGRGDNTEEYLALGAYEKKLADELLKYFVKATGAINRGAKTSDNYTGLNWSTVPSIILECGFMSNETEDYKLTSESYQRKIAEGIADWLVNTEVLKKG